MVILSVTATPMEGYAESCGVCINIIHAFLGRIPIHEVGRSSGTVNKTYNSEHDTNFLYPCGSDGSDHCYMKNSSPVYQGHSII
jgi:hypothetical protein